MEDQDRRRWNSEQITEGRALIAHNLASPAGPYAVQAAIAALHDEALDVDSTDWPQIVGLYDLLLRMMPSPVVDLNRAVAVAMRDGPAAGLLLIDRLAETPALRGYHPLHAARADLLTRLHRHAEAADSYRSAIAVVGNNQERTYLARRLAALDEGSTPPLPDRPDPPAGSNATNV